MSLEKTKCLEIADLCILDVEKDSSYLDEVSNYIHNIKKAKFSLKLSFSDAKNWFNRIAWTAAGIGIVLTLITSLTGKPWMELFNK